MTITDATSLDQNKPGNNINKDVLLTLKISKTCSLTIGFIFVFYLGHLFLGNVSSLQGMQSALSGSFEIKDRRK